MSGSPIPVAVVGVGHLGRHHARLYAASPDADLVAVIDRDAERAKSIAAEYGCEALARIEDLEGRVSAASVAVPTLDHHAVAVPLLRSGIDVLIEKPITRTLEEADEVNAVARELDRIVMVGHTERFNPATLVVADAVDSPRFFEIHRLAGFTARSTDIDVVLDLMIHDLDLLLKFDGTEAVTVDAIGVAALTDKLDIANARIRMASGCVANITASRISVETVRRVRIFQSRTYLSCDTVKREVERYRLTAAPDGSPTIEHNRLPVAEGEPLGIEINAFLDAVRTRERPAMDGEQGRRVLELAFRVSESIAESMA